jgi:hypothetical protein
MNDFEAFEAAGAHGALLREKLHLTGHGFPKTIHTLMLARKANYI